MQMVLCMFGRSNTGLVLRLPPGRYLFGRSYDCQVRFQDITVSRHHFSVNVGPADALVCDLGSRHGTAVNGQRTIGEHALRDGDQISVAGSAFLVRLLGDESDPRPGYLTVPGEGQGAPVEIPASPISDHVQTASGIGARVYIYGPGLWLGRDGVELTWALAGLLHGTGYLATDEYEGPEWGIELVLHADADVEGCVRTLTAFLHDWPAPEATVLSVTAYPATGGFQHQRIEIFGRTVLCPQPLE